MRPVGSQVGDLTSKGFILSLTLVCHDLFCELRYCMGDEYNYGTEKENRLALAFCLFRALTMFDHVMMTELSYCIL